MAFDFHALLLAMIAFSDNSALYKYLTSSTYAMVGARLVPPCDVAQAQRQRIMICRVARIRDRQHHAEDVHAATF